MAAAFSFEERTSHMAPDICIYHAHCIDGFTAAWAIYKRWPDAAFIAAGYGEALPDVAGKHVLIVDFSYKLPVLNYLALEAKSVTILDHHKSAQADLALFAVSDMTALLPMDVLALQPVSVQALFDMDKSGAMLAWEYAHPGKAAPNIVDHVQDRDLWRFALHGTKEINASLALLPMDMAVWCLTADQLQGEGWHDHYNMGSALMRQATKNCEAVIGASLTMRTIDGHFVLVVNAPHFMASEIGNILAEKGFPFAATWYDTFNNKRAFSLRSTDAGEDVSVIAAKFGGGGHRNAAGFAVDLDHFVWEPV